LGIVPGNRQGADGIARFHHALIDKDSTHLARAAERAAVADLDVSPEDTAGAYLYPTGADVHGAGKTGCIAVNGQRSHPRFAKDAGSRTGQFPVEDGIVGPLEIEGAVYLEDALLEGEAVADGEGIAVVDLVGGVVVLGHGQRFRLDIAGAEIDRFVCLHLHLPQMKTETVLEPGARVLRRHIHHLQGPGPVFLFPPEGVGQEGPVEIRHRRIVPV